MTRLWKTTTFCIFFTVTTLPVAIPASADVLQMPGDNASAPVVSVTLPGRGMTMTQVEERFGTPQQKIPEVGDPPIIRWIYPDFTVYFEYQYVINAISHVTGPAPVIPEETPLQTPSTPAANGDAMMEEAPKPDAMMPANGNSP